jgi:ABC-type bacteriocin/lantibiotic exporter with double-glycine peptidase domain
MARLSMTAPARGMTPYQAAYGLRQKLGQVGRPEQVAVVVPDLDDLHDFSKPFLAGIRFSFWTNHMVCILETTRESLVVGDPISFGRKTWSWSHFQKKWSGIIVVCQ